MPPIPPLPPIGPLARRNSAERSISPTTMMAPQKRTDFSEIPPELSARSRPIATFRGAEPTAMRAARVSAEGVADGRDGVEQSAIVIVGAEVVFGDPDNLVLVSAWEELAACGLAGTDLDAQVMRRRFLHEEHVHTVHPGVAGALLEERIKEALSILLVLGFGGGREGGERFHEDILVELGVDLVDGLAGLSHRGGGEQACAIVHAVFG